MIKKHFLASVKLNKYRPEKIEHKILSSSLSIY